MVGSDGIGASSVYTTQVVSGRTLIHIRTGDTVTEISGVTLALEASGAVQTGGLRVAVVLPVVALIDVCACSTVTDPADLTAARVGTRCVAAECLCVALVARPALVHIRTGDSVTEISGVAATLEAAGAVQTGGLGVAVVQTVDAFIGVVTRSTVTRPTESAVALVRANGVGADGVAVALVGSGALVDVSALLAVAVEPAAADALEAAIRVLAERVGVAVVLAAGALVDLHARPTVACVT